MLDDSDLIPCPLSRKLNLSGFRNEKTEFHEYLKKEAFKDHESNIGKVFVFFHKSHKKVIGYVTLAMYYLPKESHDDLNSLTRYQSIPSLLLGQMARNLEYKKQGAGPLMLNWVIDHAIKLSKKVGCRLIVLHSVNDKVNFYERNNFILVEDSGNTMFLDLFGT